VWHGDLPVVMMAWTSVVQVGPGLGDRLRRWGVRGRDGGVGSIKRRLHANAVREETEHVHRSRRQCCGRGTSAGRYPGAFGGRAVRALVRGGCGPPLQAIHGRRMLRAYGMPSMKG
jgi:hypothetical protein